MAKKKTYTVDGRPVQATSAEAARKMRKAAKSLGGGGQLTDKEMATLKRLQSKKRAAPKAKRARGKKGGRK